MQCDAIHPHKIRRIIKRWNEKFDLIESSKHFNPFASITILALFPEEFRRKILGFSIKRHFAAYMSWLMRLTRFSFDVVRVNTSNLESWNGKRTREEEKTFGMILTYFANRIEPAFTKSVNAVRAVSACTHTTNLNFPNLLDSLTSLPSSLASSMSTLFIPPNKIDSD